MDRTPPPPPPPSGPGPTPELWRARFDTARAMIGANRPGPGVEATLQQVERSLVGAEVDRARLRHTLSGLDPERITAELKQALRSPTASEELVASLRRRHETANDLLNRLDDLDQEIEATLADVETLAARTAELSLRRGSAPGPGSPTELRDQVTELRDHVTELRDHVTALEAAHRELDAL